MEFIEGITLLYSKYYDCTGTHIIGRLLVAACVVLSIGLLICFIEDHDGTVIFGIVALVLVCVGVAKFIISTPPYTEYHILIDDTVPITYLEEEFGLDNIYNEGGNVYRITIEEEE